MNRKLTTLVVVMIALVSTTIAQNADPNAAMAQVKQNLEASMKNLRGYEWIETTTVYKGSEAKSQTQKKCFYDNTGKLVKEATGSNPGGDSKQQRGVRGKIAENKKEEISAFVSQCVAKVHEYLPPKSEKLQSLYASGKSTIQVLEPNKKINLSFLDYLQPGDKLGIGLDKEKNILTGINVDTYVDKPEAKVNFSLKYEQLPDGTQYPAQTTMDLPSEGLKVIIKNDAYKKGVPR